MIDTTVWIDFFRGSPTVYRQGFETLLKRGETVCVTDLIVTELLRGAFVNKEYMKLKSYLVSFPSLSAEAPSSFVHAADLYRYCRKKGVTVRSTVDCVIAAVCLEHKTTLFHNDADFGQLSKYCGLKVLDPASIKN